MDYEDDISILPQTGEDKLESTLTTYGSRVFFPRSDSAVLSGSHHALQQAYIELKKRLNDKTLQNQQLTKRILELEAVKENSLGGSFDMMEDNSYMGEAMSVAADPQTAAEEGYVHMLRRELDRARKQIQTFEKTFEERLQQQQVDYKALAQKLQETENKLLTALREKDSLQQTLERTQREKEQVVSAADELSQKCRSLEIERDKAVKEGMSINTSLQKTQQELAELKEKQGDSPGLGLDAPPEVVKEVTHLRRVIDSLKNMVLAQKNYLVQMESRSSMSMRASLTRSLKDVGSVEQDMSPPSSNKSGGASSTTSWEMLNGAHSQSSLDAQKQRRSAQMQIQDLYSQQRFNHSAPPTSVSASIPASVTGQNMLNGSLDTSRGNQSWSRTENMYSGQIMSTGQNALSAQNTMCGQIVMSNQGVTGNQTAVPGQRRASTEVLRRKSEEDVLERRSKTEMIRSPQPPQTPTLADWMGNPLALAGTGTITSTGGNMQKGVNPPQSGGSQQGKGFHPPPPGPQQGVMINTAAQPSSTASQTRPTQNAPTHYRAGQVDNYPPRQGSPMRELPSTYDNVHFVNGNGPNKVVAGGNVGMSLHILSQTGMTGGRVVSTSKDSFGTSGGTLTNSNVGHVQPPPPAVLSRDGAQRTMPQEHSDLNMRSRTLPTNPLDLMPPSGKTRSTQASENTNAVSDSRKCPVCSQDFSHITMDEFQTHVFDCFDDVDESIGPETLQPQVKVSSTDRVCPMCSGHFDEKISQQFFEQHVQNHFEEADPFEVLIPNP